MSGPRPVYDRLAAPGASRIPTSPGRCVRLNTGRPSCSRLAEAHPSPALSSAESLVVSRLASSRFETHGMVQSAAIGMQRTGGLLLNESTASRLAAGNCAPGRN